MSNISSFVNVRWFLGGPLFKLFPSLSSSSITGIPFNSTNPFRLAIAEKGQAILGDYLLGLQAGNEPDFYAKFRKRPAVSCLSYSTQINAYTKLELYCAGLL